MFKPCATFCEGLIFAVGDRLGIGLVDAFGLIGGSVDRCVLVILAAGEALHTRTCGNELTDYDVLLESEQVIDLALYGGVGQHACGLLERSGGQERVGRKGCLGDTEQGRLILGVGEILLTRGLAAVNLIVSLVEGSALDARADDEHRLPRRKGSWQAC